MLHKCKPVMRKYSKIKQILKIDKMLCYCGFIQIIT